MCTNEGFDRNHPEHGRPSLCSQEHSQHISTVQGLETTHWGFHLHFDENGPPREETMPYLTRPLTTTRTPHYAPSQWTVGLFYCRWPAAQPINDVGQFARKPKSPLRCQPTEKITCLIYCATSVSVLPNLLS